MYVFEEAELARQMLTKRKEQMAEAVSKGEPTQTLQESIDRLQGVIDTAGRTAPPTRFVRNGIRRQARATSGDRRRTRGLGWEEVIA